MDNGRLDDILKRKLENLHGDEAPLHWDLLWQQIQLDPELAASISSAQRIDEFFKASLEEVSAEPPVAGDWDAFQQKLMDTTSSDSFDETFRHALTDVESIPDFNAWQQMAARMEADADERTDAERDFDEALKEKMDLVTPMYAAHTWDLLQETMSMEDEWISDEDLVEKIQESLGQLHQPYNASHWEIMRAQLLEQQSILYQLYRFKVAEISLLLLAIFTVINFWPQIEHALPNEKNLSPRSEQTLLFAKADDDSESKANLKQDEAGFLNTGNQFGQEMASSPSSETKLPVERVEPPSAGGGNLDLAVTSQVQQSQFALTARDKERTVYLPLEKHPIVLLEVPVRLIPEDAAPLRTSNRSPFQSLETKTILAEADTRKERVIAADPNPRKKHVQIGMFGNFDVNYIMTPYNEEFQEEAYAQWTPGYGGGLSIGWDFHRWGVETGLIYASQYYEPILNIEFDRGSFFGGYAGRGLQAARINLVNIPLQVYYNFTPDSKWEWYGIAGASMKVMMETHYDFRTFTIGGPPPAATPGGGRNLIPGPSLQQRHEEQSYNGILDGGEFFKNKYYSFNLGFGLERRLNHRWGVFMQPIYQHQWSDGKGPNRDLINAISISTGLKVNL